MVMAVWIMGLDLKAVCLLYFFFIALPLYFPLSVRPLIKYHVQAARHRYRQPNYLQFHPESDFPHFEPYIRSCYLWPTSDGEKRV